MLVEPELTVPDTPEVTRTLTLTVREMRQVERALECSLRRAGHWGLPDSTLIDLCALRSRFLDAIDEAR